ncbi:MAG: choice-of-anchor D domain-containing protein [Ignavibacteriae bacterium]|nr:choice-of-anchor D domain-containing protein [Ignavibacteriota bacterium]
MKRLFFVLVATLVFSLPLAAQSIIDVFRLPNATYYNSGWGLTADSSNLYFSSNTSDATLGRKILKLSFTAQGVDSVMLPPGVVSSQGLARDGDGNFYYLRRYTSVGTIMKFSPAGVLIDSLRLGSSKFPGGLAWDGSHVWYSIYSPDVEAGLYKVNWATKQVVDTILVPTLQPYGVTWDGTYLWYVENGFQGDPQGMFKVNPVTGDTAGFIPAPVDPSGTRPNSAAWDGRYMWLLAEPVGANTGRALYKYDLSGGGTPDINLMPDSVDFGYTRMGSARSLNVFVQNVGTAPLRIDTLNTPLGVIWASFGQPLPVTIPPGGMDTIFVGFDPMVYGAFRFTFQVISNDPDEHSKPLLAKGFGIYASSHIDAPTAYDFGSRRGGSSNVWYMTIQNQGGPQLVISGMTVGMRPFNLDSLVFPVTIDSLQSKSFRVWFRPTAATSYVDTLKITSNASNGPLTTVVLTGIGNNTTVPMGQPFWTYTVPNNPRTSSNAKLIKGVRAISDINNDGKADVVVSSENYWTMALNGNASVSNDTLWAFNTYIANTSAGSIGSTGDYSHQKALAVANLNGDAYKDVIIGTGGGNEHVYALNGRNGQILWQFGTDHPDSFGLGDITGVDASIDFTGDGIVDVVAAGRATETGGVGGRRSVYLFNGATGTLRWSSPLPGFTHAVTAIGDISGDGQPDVIGCVGEAAYKATAFSGVNGNLLWDFSITGSSSGAKEVLAWPVQGQTPDVIVSGFWGPIFRVDGESGTQMWSRPTNGNSAMQLLRLKDVTGDGIDEIVAPLLVGGAYCINGANGNIVWSLPTGNTMGGAVIPDLNRDGIDDVALAVQNQGVMIVKGQDGAQLALYPTGTAQAREVAIVPDLDGNLSYEIIMGGKDGNVALISGGDLLVSVGENVNGIPERFELGQNYPNPFNPSTTIDVSVPSQANLALKIYDVLGREVKSFEYENVPAGTHQIVWDGKSNAGTQVASGVYFYRLTAGSSVLTKQMVLVK